MITAPEIIAIMETALVVVSGCLGLALLEVRRVITRGDDWKWRTKMAEALSADRLDLIRNLAKRNVKLRAELDEHTNAEAKRQAQRIAASAAAARARAAKGKS